MTTDIYARLVRPVATVVAICGLLSCAVLLAHGEPEVTTLDPDTLLYTLVAVLAVFGVLVPGLMAIRTAATPTWWRVAGFFLAMTANAVTQGGGLGAFPHALLAYIAIGACLAMCTLGLVAIGERPSGTPPQSRL